MIIIEASHIYFGGGYSLLIELLKYLSNNNFPSKVYVQKNDIYEAIYNKRFRSNEVIKTSTIWTFLRYLRKRNNIIFFTNLPPFVRNNKALVYFHNELILNHKFFNRTNLKLSIYYYWIKFLSKNVDTVACQTGNIAKGLNKIGVNNVSILPFFEEIVQDTEIEKRYTFCYICSSAPHKNVHRLFKAITLLAYDYDISLAVTIDKLNSNYELLQQIEDINKNVGRDIIINHGLLSKKEVIKIYRASKALVFPSLKESMGLPLIEANMCGIKILSSDLPYSYEIIDFPIVFDPYSPEDMADKMRSFLNGEYNHIFQKLKIKNRIEELINIII